MNHIGLSLEKKFAVLRPTKCTILFHRYLYYSITLNIATCFDRQGITIRESERVGMFNVML
jgi:hypothetical protein